MLQWISSHQDMLIDTAKAIIEILILWVLAYQVYKLFRSTRGAKILWGLILSFVALILLSSILKLTVIGFMITRILGPGLFLGLVIIFQPELRTGLAKIGTNLSNNPLFSRYMKFKQADFIENLCKAVTLLSNKRFGALFAIEREVNLKLIEESGVRLDAVFSPELALNIFYPKTALHDGGVIISQERIEAAGCVFPVSAKEMNDRTLGLRHRAAVGISEETDALVIIVSEETGAIAISYSGRLERNIEPENLKNRLEELLKGEKNHAEKITV